MAQTFLRAAWRKLIMANYVVDPEILQPYLPTHTELDYYDGQCFVSLVGFLFEETRLLGIRIPMHERFQEVNLRFYVKYKGPDGLLKRGVVFISELVPRYALSFVANTFYGEHYRTLPMRHKWKNINSALIVGYRWKEQYWHKLQVTAQREAKPIAVGSEEEFITEHYWGYTRLRNGLTSEYEVVHPRWDIYPVQRYVIDVDFAASYGADFSMLNDMQPKSVLLAEGSNVIVRSGSRIKISGQEMQK